MHKNTFVVFAELILIEDPGKSIAEQSLHVEILAHFLSFQFQTSMHHHFGTPLNKVPL